MLKKDRKFLLSIQKELSGVISMFEGESPEDSTQGRCYKLYERILDYLHSPNPIRITKEQLFNQQAPSFNFELDADQLLAKALKDGYVKKINLTSSGDDEYYINEDYKNGVEQCQWLNQ